MVAVLISIKPKWCDLILRGEKTIEVRKSRPKLQTPFKCYIYCTQGAGRNTLNIPVPYERLRDDYIETGSMKSLNCPIGNGKVIGEFICDHIYQCTTADHLDGTDISIEEVAERACLSRYELEAYELSAEAKENQIYMIGLYGWRISNLKIYNEPKLLCKFRNPCKEYEKDNPQCGNCDFYHSMGEYPAECGCDGAKPLTRPPQSWCYVEEK